jgi:nitrogen regulatory protein P-II 1
MKLVTAVVRPHVVEGIREALEPLGVQGMTISEVQGHGRQGGHTEIYRGAEYKVNFLPKAKVEIVCDDALLEDIIEAISKEAGSGKIGDGKIWVSEVLDLVRIRTGERGRDAL